MPYIMPLKSAHLRAFHPGISESSMSLNKNLRCRFVIFDLNVLIGDSVPEVMKPQQHSSISDSSKNEKPSNANVSTTTAPLKKDIPGISTVVSKYMDKIRHKVGGEGGAVISDYRGGGIGNKVQSPPVSTATLLAQTKASQQVKEPSRWLLGEGMGDIVDFITNRTILLGIVPRKTTPKSVIETLKQQLKSTPFIIVDRFNERGEEMETFDSQLARMEKTYSYTPIQALIVSSTGADDQLMTGKSRGYYTLKYNKNNSGTYGQITPDFLSTSAIEIQDALEELNKVAFRPTAFNSRQY